LILASVTEGLVNDISHLVREGGWPAILALMAASAACIPVPSEVVMLFAGFAVGDPGKAHAHLSMAVVLAAGLGGSLLGSWLAYAVGRAGRLELLRSHGRYLHISAAQLERAERWFDRFGEPVVFFGRLVPFLRSFVSLPAGIARMGLVRFTALTALASALWVAALAYAGEALGSEWQSVRRGFEYVDYIVVAAIVVGIVYLVVRRRARPPARLGPADAGE